MVAICLMNDKKRKPESREGQGKERVLIPRDQRVTRENQRSYQGKGL